MGLFVMFVCAECVFLYQCVLSTIVNTTLSISSGCADILHGRSDIKCSIAQLLEKDMNQEIMMVDATP